MVTGSPKFTGSHFGDKGRAQWAVTNQFPPRLPSASKPGLTPSPACPLLPAGPAAYRAHTPVCSGVGRGLAQGRGPGAGSRGGAQGCPVARRPRPSSLARCSGPAKLSSLSAVTRRLPRAPRRLRSSSLRRTAAPCPAPPRPAAAGPLLSAGRSRPSACPPGL